MLKIGIEQEIVFLNENGDYVDADNTGLERMRAWAQTTRATAFLAR